MRIRKAPVAAGNATDAPLMNGRVFLKSFFLGGQFGEFFSPFSLDLPLLSAFGTVWRCFPLSFFCFFASLLPAASVLFSVF